MEDQTFSKTIGIHASAAKVWEALTVPACMAKWMSETPLDIITDWQKGSEIIIGWALYNKRVESKGTVLLFEPEQRLQYSHISSLSRLDDKPENYSILDFNLVPTNGHTTLTLTLHNFPTETIYKHLAFYWNVALELLKRFIEG